MKRWNPFVKTPAVVPVIALRGTIAMAGRTASLNDFGLGPMIERAFKRRKPAAVALVINSPGGSPVQSSLIAARIRRLADEKKIPVFAFVEDVAASGGYWLATAADEIWVDPSSVVGSIGVISSGFGFQELIGRYGVERRVHTAGKSKSTLDPFKPEKAADVKMLNALLTQMHETFIGQVKDRRGSKLADNSKLFSGEFWLGQASVDLGLSDGIGHLIPKMKERFGNDVRFIPYNQKHPFLQRFGVRLMEETMAGVEERVQFARFGL